LSTNVPPSVATILNEADCSGAVSEELISEVERQRGLAFPAEYRAFLSRCGAALLSGDLSSRPFDPGSTAEDWALVEKVAAFVRGSVR